ncbi:MAG: DEAD/DEAH box helicase [Chlamydiae bacterium]|nr:DEAD/DEAH box helicase [Chlamydiota bacterium]
MLNVRKLKQDYSQAVLREGKELFDSGKVLSAKIINIDATSLRISAKIEGQFNNTYESEIEIDRDECETIDSDCDCPYHYDCQHLAALLFYLEAHLDEILVNYSKETNLEALQDEDKFDEKQKEVILEAVKEAAIKQEQKQDEQYQRELMQEYILASKTLSVSPFFLPKEERQTDTADLALIFTLPPANANIRPIVELQLALRLKSRSKPLHIPCAKDFIDGLRHEEPLYIGGKKYLFSLDSFKEGQKEIARMLMDYGRVHDKPTTEKSQRCAFIELKSFGLILAEAYETAQRSLGKGSFSEEDLPHLPCIYEESLENPVRFSPSPALFRVSLEYIEPPAKKILLNPMISLYQSTVQIEEARLLECAHPGLIFDHVYYRFASHITRQHLMHLMELREITVPEPLFGTFIENSLPELARYVDLLENGISSKFVTIPYVHNVKAICNLSYLDGELEAELFFDYEGFKVPSAVMHLSQEHLSSFVSKEGVVARNLVEEKVITDDLFQGFLFSEETGLFVAKTEKKIIEFMTEVIPRNQERVTFNCPQNLLDQFIYDKTEFALELSHTDKMQSYKIALTVNGDLAGTKLDRLWECVLSRRAFLELSHQKKAKKGEKSSKIPKILVLDLDRIAPVIQIFDELGIDELDTYEIERPLWSIANIDESNFKDLPVKFSMTKKLQEIRSQMLGEVDMEFSSVPKEIKADLRAYQIEGIHWLERLRSMYLNGVLADDMGLGKTVQAIVAVTQAHKNEGTSIIVCPTSLLYNWKEEFAKFNPHMKVMIVDGVPSHRKKMIEAAKDVDIIVTSYSLLQKDIEQYQAVFFKCVILDEAQHIKNRGTRNAKSVKMLKSEHRMILSGTPIENSLEELWSLFDFLMPGFLSTFDRFLEKYIRSQGEEHTKNLEYLRKKVAPFIMRRMKSDVLHDLPPVSELVYHCPLSDVQLNLYRSYAASARDELVKLVERDGFDKVQIHVLATLTRLKQICCHPAIFAKESAEDGDSAKYEMMNDLLTTLIEGGHKTVIFSQYTKMLQIMKTDFEQKGIRFVYLDGTSKNRLEIVKKFNEDPTISVFLVSLKAGGTGLNLVGADTVIHYDMWWNPAVENQATDRVHRMGQDKNVSVYKLVSLGTIEEKIVEMQKRKQGLVKKVVSSDEEALSKLTWEDVLELLET